MRTMSPHAEALNLQLLSTKKLLSHVYNLHGNEPYCDSADVQLRRLEEKLASFDPENVYCTIQKDLEDKYQLAAEYYAELDRTRDDLLNENKIDHGKEQQFKIDLRNKLDQVVNTLRKDFTPFIDEYYALFDTLFVLHTNTFSRREVNELEDKVSKCLETAEKIYNEEYRKIERIYELLENEGLRLNQALEIN